MSQSQIRDILTKYKTVAVVGLSREPEKPSYSVSAYMKEHGFRIIPVNPFADEVLGEKSYKSLLEIPAAVQETIEIVDIFRPSRDVLPIVEQTIKLKVKFGKPFVVWMQLGIMNQLAEKLAQQAGLIVVMDRCIKQELEEFY